MTYANVSPESFKGRSPARRSISPVVVMFFLIVALAFVCIVSMSVGPVMIPIDRIATALFSVGAEGTQTARDHLILLSIRLPRVIMSSIVGALLAVAGAVMQGLFRNPLADPGLVGVSAGAGLAAAAVIVGGDRELPRSVMNSPFLLPAAAFLGALAMTAMLYRIATWQGRTSIAMMLLAGLALGALANSGTGLLVFLANDQQLRDITFWLLGSLAGATWLKITAITPFLVLLLACSFFVSRALDLLSLGEAEAFYMGIAVERLKRFLIVLVAAAAGAAVSVSGIIGFVGIIVPHLLRLVIGPGHRLLLPASACCGAIILLASDTLARTVAAPAELPIGIVTAILGAPFFLFLLSKQRSLLSG
jgi:iron complex transport system permease protein